VIDIRDVSGYCPTEGKIAAVEVSFKAFKSRGIIMV
jgi:hypothetical protein